MWLIPVNNGAIFWFGGVSRWSCKCCLRISCGGGSFEPRETCSSQQQWSVQKMFLQTIEVLHKDTQGLVHLLWSFACVLVILLSELYFGGRLESKHHYPLSVAHNHFKEDLKSLEGGRVHLFSLRLVLLSIRFHLPHELEQRILSFRWNLYCSRWCD